MIILEGVDKSGKTTLANKLSSRFDLEICKFGIPNGNPIPEYIKELESRAEPVIYDRFIYGEVPYSIVKKRTRFMKYLELRILDLMVQSHPHLVIYARPSREELAERHRLERDAYVDLTEAFKLYEEYDDLFENITANSMFFRGDQDYAIIEKYIENIVLSPVLTKNFVAWRNLNFPGIGTLRPRYMFVGERYNYNAEYQVTLCSSSGEYLFRCLDEAGFGMDDCHFTNAIYDGRSISKDVIDILNPVKIVALGNTAFEVLADSGVSRNIIKITHPAYHKRFESSSRTEYVESLRAINS